MKKVIITILILVSQISYGQTKKDTKDVFFGDTTIAIIKYNSLPEQNKTYLFGKSKETNLTISEIAEIDVILNRCIEEYNLKQEKYYEENKEKLKKFNKTRERFLIDLKRYKRQYVAVINAKGEKKVLVNCFCSYKENYWKEHFLEIEDGGKCFFHLRINLKTKKFYEFSVNGDA